MNKKNRFFVAIFAVVIGSPVFFFFFFILTTAKLLLLCSFLFFHFHLKKKKKKVIVVTEVQKMIKELDERGVKKNGGVIYFRFDCFLLLSRSPFLLIPFPPRFLFHPSVLHHSLSERKRNRKRLVC